MTTALWLLGVVGFVIALAATIAVHEWGHLFAAKKFKLDVPEYSVGFGPKLFTKMRNGTAYSVRMIPLGGFVMIKDPHSEEGTDEQMLLSHVSPWKRTVVFLAGPAVNILIGLTLLIGLFMTVTIQTPNGHIESVCTDSSVACPAEKAGIKDGDQIVAVDGEAVTDPTNISAILQEHLADAPESIEVTVARNGAEETVTLAPVYSEEEKRALIGVTLAADETRPTFVQSTQATGRMIETQIRGVMAIPSKVPLLIDAITGHERDPETPVSVVGAARYSGDVTASTELTSTNKFQNFWLLVASFNLGIGILNLLPFLPLDGGRILIAFFDAVKKRWAKVSKKEYAPTGTRFIGAMTAVFGVLLLGYMGLVIVADLVNPVSL